MLIVCVTPLLMDYSVPLVTVSMRLGLFGTKARERKFRPLGDLHACLMLEGPRLCLTVACDCAFMP